MVVNRLGRDRVKGAFTGRGVSNYDPCLPRLHPGGCRLSGTTSIPRRRLSSARLDVLRILAADHSPRHPALRARRRHCATPEPAGISLGCAPNQHLREIRHGTTGRQKNGSLSPCLLSRNFAEPQTLEKFKRTLIRTNTDSLPYREP